MNREYKKRIVDDYKEPKDRVIRIMEVCGTHTQAISKSGIRYILPQYVKLLSGPGCPVCVTNEAFIDLAIELLSRDDIILATFGDMLKVKGTYSSLADEKSKDSVVAVYSPEDALTLARRKKDKTVVFLAVGFETTAPIIAAIIKSVYENGPKNLLFLTAIKRMEPVLRFILNKDSKRIDGLICPGHVASVLGSDSFRFVTDEFNIPAVVSGFRTKDVKGGIYNLLDQIEGRKRTAFSNQYVGCVSSAGNKLAQKYMQEVYKIEDGYWRGIGLVPNSALCIKEKYKMLDAKNVFNLVEKDYNESSSCQCSEIILGIKAPYECKLFGVSCTPETPRGPCMVSSEGACSAHYKYGRVNFGE